MAELKIQIVKVEDIDIKEKNLHFKAYKTLTDAGKFMDVRFRSDVKNTPEEPCIIVVDDSMCNVDDQRRYPVLWVKEVKRIEPLPKRESNVGKYFAYAKDTDGYEDSKTEEKLPF